MTSPRIFGKRGTLLFWINISRFSTWHCYDPDTYLHQSTLIFKVNIVVLVLGIVAAMSFARVPGQMYSVGFGMILLMGFSMAAYFLDFNRLYIYGLIVGFSPLIGEWLWNQGLASHHGFPITFSASAGIMILVGLAVFVRLLRNNPVPIDGISSGEAWDD